MLCVKMVMDSIFGIFRQNGGRPLTESLENYCQFALKLLLHCLQCLNQEITVQVSPWHIVLLMTKSWVHLGEEERLLSGLTCVSPGRLGGSCFDMVIDDLTKWHQMFYRHLTF